MKYLTAFDEANPLYMKRSHVETIDAGSCIKEAYSYAH